MAWHDGRDRVLVDELGMTVAPQQYAKIIEPSHDALQFDAVYEKNREWDFGFADMIEKGVLEILCAIGCHGRYFRCLSAVPPGTAMERSRRHR
jgi:hypothetical protein